MLKNEIGVSFQRIIELLSFTQTFITKLNKYGFGIRKNTYSGSGSRGHKAPDPGPGVKRHRIRSTGHRVVVTACQPL
jgi:hypothetical protein